MAVNLQEEYNKTNIQGIIDQLEEDLVGLVPVKARIGLHMSFTGSPGTGKTAVANRMADILFKLGYIRKGHLITVTRDDLVGQYIGHTAPKTKEVLKRAMGGVLFIDEAYYLYKPDNERDYGSEAIEILLQVMENQREDLVVIFAGYKDRMDSFYESNPGLSSRVANHIDFPDYTPTELIQIARLILEEQQYRMNAEAEAALLEYIEKRATLPLFANARTISNAIDTARMRHANRMFNSGDKILTKSDLVTIEAEDIRKSSLFSEISE
jgi:probable Rubsico expression protein CbbX